PAYLLLLPSYNSCYSERHGHHAHSHSFPTRRSSDLLGQPNCSTMVAAAPETIVAAVPSKKMIMSPSTAGARRGPTAHWMTGRWEDRKSTRLNSSHVKISYAVFCLKKKIQHPSDLKDA